MKKANFIVYFCAIVVIYCVVVFSGNFGIPLLKYIAYGAIAIGAILAISYFTYMMVVRKQNTKLFQLIEDGHYDEGIEQVKKKLSKNHELFQVDLYNYLLTRAYIFKDEKEQAEIYINQIVVKDTYPTVYYYLACIQFLKDQYDEIGQLHNQFTSSPEYRRVPESYSELNKLFTAMCKYVVSKKDGKEKLKLVKTDTFSIPLSKQVIEKINNTIIEEAE